MLGAIISAIAPFLVGKLMGDKGSASTKATPAASTATQTELERLALERVRQSQPLYEAVLKMAGGRMPNAYRPGGPGLPSSAPALPRAVSQNVTAPSAPDVPDYAQQIVESFRSRESGGAVTLRDPATGETRTVEPGEAAALRAQGWVPALTSGRGGF